MTGRALELASGRAMYLFVLKLSHQTRRELQKNLIRCALSKQLEKRYFLAFDSGIIDEEEFLLLYEENTSKNPSFGNEDYNKFDFNSIDPATSKADFRVEKNDLSMLKEALNIPDQIVCHQSSICDGMEALCKVLKRLAYPCRYSDMIPLFARPVPVLSMLSPR